MRKCAVRLEFNAMSYAVNTEGYIAKIEARVKAGSALGLDSRLEEVDECMDCLISIARKTS